MQRGTDDQFVARMQILIQQNNNSQLTTTLITVNRVESSFQFPGTQILWIFRVDHEHYIQQRIEFNTREKKTVRKKQQLPLINPIKKDWSSFQQYRLWIMIPGEEYVCNGLLCHHFTRITRFTLIVVRGG